jgi:Family of unknown function (DUF5678)
MTTITAENVLQLIDQMSLTEQLKLKQLMAQRSEPQAQPEATASSQTKPLDKRVPPIRMPSNGAESLRWLAEHRREYAGQWVALDGTRLIAHGPNHDDVWAAAQADGAYLPLVTFVEDPDNIVHIIWA